jgi:hypothetical protein
MLKSTSKCGVETDKKPAGMSRKRPSPDVGDASVQEQQLE